jgi:zinc transporter
MKGWSTLTCSTATVAAPLSTGLKSKKLDSSQGLLWIHLDSQNANAKTRLEEQSGLAGLTCESLLEQETLPRNTLTADGLLLILRGVNCNPGEDTEDMVAISAF